MPQAIGDDVFRSRIRVYWEDTDAGGIVFYANYLKYFERARTEWLRAAGFSQQQLRVDRQVMFIVAETRVRYLLPARLDDELEISVVRIDGGRVGMGLAQQAWRIGDDGQPQQLLCEGEIRIACVDAGTFRPCRIPNDLLDALE
ncbi:tol-pal system-associated acyl-CoA thioesterase [Piscinibacter sakaiensis]|uniref:tol-pal system-associated acyl-CoA thioesterase n=1 Tax=Piscinibacter sakaiensis TaxID=1547922 RepID=UPI003AAF8F8A